MTACMLLDGSLSSVYWPNVGFAEQLKEASTGVFVKSGDRGRFYWLDDRNWEVKQGYLPRANIIETTYRGHGLEISKTAFVDKELDVLVTAFVLSAEGPGSKDLRLLQYQNPELDETRWGNAAFYDKMHDSVMQYHRETYFAFGGIESSSSHQCGIVHGKDDARADCEDGRLENRDAALYRGRRGVNSALAYDVGTVMAGQRKHLAYILAAGRTREQATALLETARSIGPRSLRERTRAYWASFLGERGRALRRPADQMVERSVLILKLLCDANTGGIIASPSTDPDYRYVWPRDGFFAAMALDRTDHHREAADFYLWCVKAQDRQGVLRQRYYATPELVGPSWGPSWGEEIDETSAAIWGAVDHFRQTRDRGFLSEVWPFIRQGAWYLVGSVDESGRVNQTMDLWEQNPSRHIYSTASVCAALAAASKVALQLSSLAEARHWARVSKAVRKVLLEEYWSSELGHFIRSTEPRDERVDISSLALSFPYSILPSRDARMIKTARSLAEAFHFRAGGVGRFPGDLNYGGNPWILAACWLAIQYASVRDLGDARALLRWCVKHAGALGMLPEQLDKDAGTPLSAVPLAWSHAMFILASYALHGEGKTSRDYRRRGRTGGSRRTRPPPNR